MMWHVARGGEEEFIQRFVGNLRERDPFEETGIDGRIILR